MILGQQAQATADNPIKTLVENLTILIAGEVRLTPRQRAVAYQVLERVTFRAQAGRTPAITPTEFNMLYNVLRPRLFSSEPAKL